jgi:hypothetical protein
MRPKDYFGLIVRTFGLVVLLAGLHFLLSAIYVFATPNLPHKSPLISYAIYGFVLIALSLYFLRGAPALVRFSYPEDSSQDSHVHHV